MLLFAAYTKQLEQVEIWKDKEPGVELIYLDYKDVLNNTSEILDKVSAFVGLDLNKEAMSECIDKTLKRKSSNQSELQVIKTKS